MRGRVESSPVISNDVCWGSPTWMHPSGGRGGMDGRDVCSSGIKGRISQDFAVFAIVAI